MPGIRHTMHTVEPVYAPPVLRAPSPTDSINTEYDPDEASSTDGELNDEEFARHVEEQIGLRRTTWADAGPARPVILPRTKDSKEEQIMFDRVMQNLREKVKEVEDEELFDTVTQQNPSPALFVPQPSSRDVEAIMRSMLPQSKAPPQNPPSYPLSYPPSFPSSFNAQIPRTSGEGSGVTLTGLRYRNLGRDQ